MALAGGYDRIEMTHPLVGLAGGSDFTNSKNGHKKKGQQQQDNQTEKGKKINEYLVYKYDKDIPTS